MSAAHKAVLGHANDNISQSQLISCQIRGLVAYTVQESFHRWTLITYLIGITFFLVLLSTAVNLDIVEGTLASARLFGQNLEIGGQEIPVDNFVRWFQVGIITILYSIGVLLALFLTCNHIPAMVREGWGGLLIAQPVSRSTLLLGRAFGSVTVISIGVAYLVVGSWAVLRIKTGLGSTGFLFAGLTILLVYSICYSATILAGIITRNGPVSGMVGLMAWIAGHAVYPFHAYTEWQALAFSPGWRRQVGTAFAEGLYWTFPKSQGMWQVAVAAAQNEPVSFLPILYSIPFAALCMFLACWWFARSDY